MAEKVKIVKLETGQISESDIPAAESRVIQAFAKPLVDAQQALQVFFFADEVVRHLINQLDS